MYWLGYILGTVMFIIGLLLLVGLLQFRAGTGDRGDMLRTVFGLVLMLYGIYRVALTVTQRRGRDQ